MNLHDKARFFISGPLGNRQVFPITEKLQFNKEFDDDLCAFRENLETDMIFKGDDFLHLYEYEKDYKNCYDVQISIELLCNDEWKERFKGRLKLNDSDWCLVTCKAVIPVETVDLFDCITKDWNTTKNYLDIIDRVTIDTLIGEVECEQVTNYGGPLPGPPPGTGWTITEQITVDQIEQINFVQGPIVRILQRLTYCREKWTGTGTPPPDLGFVLDADGMYYRPLTVRPLPKIQSNTLIGNPQVDQSDFTIQINCTIPYEVIDIEIDSGITFADMIDFYFGQDCCIKSDFFNINPDGTAPDNQAYQFAQAYLHDLIFFSGSDVVIATDAENAQNTGGSAGRLKGRKLWEDLKCFFNLKMIQDKNDDCLRIEHISYIKQGQTLDLRKLPNDLLKTKSKYKKNIEDFPQFERFSYPVPSESQDWDGAYIEYDSACANDADDEKELEVLHTNIAFFYNSEEKIDDGKDLLFLVSGNGTSVNSIGGAFSGGTVLNGPLSWPIIIENLHIWDRPMLSGVMNGRVFTFLTCRKQRKHEELTIKFCCDEYFDTFCDPVEFKTYFGIAEIDGAGYCIPSEFLTLNLKV